jgi:hypothetical protein
VVSSRPFLGIAVPAKTISTEALRSIAFPGLEGAAHQLFPRSTVFISEQHHRQKLSLRDGRGDHDSGCRGRDTHSARVDRIPVVVRMHVECASLDSHRTQRT